MIIPFLLSIISFGTSLYYFKDVQKETIISFINEIKQTKRIQIQSIQCLDFIQFTEIFISFTLILMIISKTSNIFRKLFSFLIVIELFFKFYWYKISSFYLLINYCVNISNFIFQLLFSHSSNSKESSTSKTKGKELPKKRFNNVNYGGQKKKIVNPVVVETDENKESMKSNEMKTSGIKLKTSVSDSLLQRKLDIEDQLRKIKEKQEQMENEESKPKEEKQPIVIKEQKEAIQDLLNSEQQLIKVQRRRVQAKRTTKISKVKSDIETKESTEEKNEEQHEKRSFSANDLLLGKNMLKKHVKK